jgi:hypothetical protein
MSVMMSEALVVLLGAVAGAVVVAVILAYYRDRR